MESNGFWSGLKTVGTSPCVEGGGGWTALALMDLFTKPSTHTSQGPGPSTLISQAQAPPFSHPRPRSHSHIRGLGPSTHTSQAQTPLTYSRPRPLNSHIQTQTPPITHPRVRPHSHIRGPDPSLLAHPRPRPRPLHALTHPRFRPLRSHIPDSDPSTHTSQIQTPPLTFPGHLHSLIPGPSTHSSQTPPLSHSWPRHCTDD